MMIIVVPSVLSLSLNQYVVIIVLLAKKKGPARALTVLPSRIGQNYPFKNVISRIKEPASWK